MNGNILNQYHQNWNKSGIFKMRRNEIKLRRWIFLLPFSFYFMPAPSMASPHAKIVLLFIPFFNVVIVLFWYLLLQEPVLANTLVHMYKYTVFNQQQSRLKLWKSTCIQSACQLVMLKNPYHFKFLLPVLSQLQ